MKRNQNKNILLKRIGSRTIDFLLPTIPGVITYIVMAASLKYNSPFIDLHKIISLPSFLWYIYAIVIIPVLIISRGSTIGDGFMKIKYLDLKNPHLTFSKVFIKEGIILAWLGYIIDSGNILSFIILIWITIPVYKVKEYHQRLSMMDIVFKLHMRILSISNKLLRK